MKYILLVVASVVAMGLNATEEVTWTLVTDMSNLPNGTYAIVANEANGYKALQSVEPYSNGGFGFPTANGFVFDAQNDATYVPENVLEFNIQAIASGSYSIQNSTDNRYLCATEQGSTLLLWYTSNCDVTNCWRYSSGYWRWQTNTAALCFRSTYFDAVTGSTAKTPIYLVRKTVTVIPDPTPDYTRDFATTDLTTICLPRAVAAGDFTGAEFYRVLYKEGNPVTDIVLEQVPSLAAGKPYIVVPTADRLECYYSGEATSAGNENGLYGTLTAITDGEAGAVGNKLEHNWVIYNNEFWRCGASCSMSANRAYLVMDEVPTQAQSMPVPGRQQMSVSKAQQGGVGTELSHPTEMPENTKYLYNGRLLIRHNGQVYDVMGRINAGQR